MQWSLLMVIGSKTCHLLWGVERTEKVRSRLNFKKSTLNVYAISVPWPTFGSVLEKPVEPYKAGKAGNDVNQL